MPAPLPSPDAPLAGRCRCGRTTIAITAPQAFRVTAGSPVRGGAKTPQLEHNFCPDCMSWMFTRIAGVEDFLNVRPTMLDDPRWSEPFIETVTAEKLPWATTPARHSYPGYPPPEDYGQLLAAFAAGL